MVHAVIVYFRISDIGFGSQEERDAIWDLGEQLDEVVEAASAGELDGDEFGEGEGLLYFYGPDADRLFAVIGPLLRAAPAARGGHVIKRYGEASDLEAKEVRVAL